MLKKYNPQLESQNYQDGADFSYNDACIFVVYPAGASGDLLASIVNSHYIATGADYFGITEVGKVVFQPSDYKLINLRHRDRTHNLEDIFTEQLLSDLVESFYQRNVAYSLLDQMIFSTHLNQDCEVDLILNKFPNAKIIRIVSRDSRQDQLINYQAFLKNNEVNNLIKFDDTIIYHTPTNVNPQRLLNVNYIDFFDEYSFNNMYKTIVEFLDLDSRLIRFDFVEFYLKQQTIKFRTALQQYKDQF